MSSDDERAPSPEETESARALRDALAGDGPDDGPDELLRVVERVRATTRPAEPLSGEARQAAVRAALDRGRPRVARRWLAGLAAAAALLLALGALLLLSVGRRPLAVPEEALAAATDDLFDGPFSEEQTAAERVDLILSARRRGYFIAMAESR